MSYVIGDRVAFTMNTGRPTTGVVVAVLTEPRQAPILLLERPEDRWRAFRLESEVSRREKNQSDRPPTQGRSQLG